MAGKNLQLNGSLQLEKSPIIGDLQLAMFDCRRVQKLFFLGFDASPYFPVLKSPRRCHEKQVSTHQSLWSTNGNAIDILDFHHFPSFSIILHHFPSFSIIFHHPHLRPLQRFGCCNPTPERCCELRVSDLFSLEDVYLQDSKHWTFH